MQYYLTTTSSGTKLEQTDCVMAISLWSSTFSDSIDVAVTCTARQFTYLYPNMPHRHAAYARVQICAGVRAGGCDGHARVLCEGADLSPLV